MITSIVVSRLNITTKEQKRFEANLHDELHNNIFLLTQEYPPTKEFQAVFKKDMFVKSNSAAFQQVTHYLFTILDPDLTKKKIPLWPLYDSKSERDFRKQVAEMTDAIRAKYEQVAIPPIMPSQLVCPGGYNFAKYVLKLSMLVMCEHLKKNVATKESQLLSPIRQHPNPVVTNAIVRNLKLKTGAVEARVKQTWQNFQEEFVAATAGAGSLVEDLARLEGELRGLNLELKELKMGANQTRRVDGEGLDGLREEMAHLEGIRNLCKMCRESLTYLNNDRLELKFNKNESIPKSFGCLNVVDGEELNLHNFFSGLTVLLASGDFDMSASSNQLNDIINFVSELTEKYNKLINN
jgi:hypothetical protein